MNTSAHPLKILFIIDVFADTAGTERILSVIANGLAAKYEVSILTAWQGNKPDAFPLHADIRRCDLGMDADGYPLRILRKRAMRRRLFAFLAMEHYDVAISLGGRNMMLLPFSPDASIKVLWYHFCLNNDLIQRHDPTKSFLSRWARLRKHIHKISIAKSYDRIVALTRKDATLWQEYCRSVDHIYNVLTVSPKSVLSYDTKRVIAVGRLTFQKGFDSLIRAWSILHAHYPEWHLDIYGVGKLRSALQAQIDRAALQDCVHLCGNSPDMPQRYAEHSIAVMSSHYEGLPLALIEAAGCGLPLVSYDCECGPSEIIQDGHNGFLVPRVGDHEALAQALMRLMADAELRRSMGMAAARSLQAFSHEAVMASWDGFLSSLER